MTTLVTLLAAATAATLAAETATATHLAACAAATAACTAETAEFSAHHARLTADLSLTPREVSDAAYAATSETVKTAALAALRHRTETGNACMVAAYAASKAGQDLSAYEHADREAAAAKETAYRASMRAASAANEDR